jgi:hypothetical protein
VIALDRLQDFGVEALALGLGEDLLDVGRDGGLVLFQALDALDDGAQPGGGGAVERIGARAAAFNVYLCV